MRNKLLFLLVPSCLLAGGVHSFAQDMTNERPVFPSDISLSGGLVSGSAKTPSLPNSINVTGVLIKAAYYRPVTRAWEGQLSAGAVTDTGTMQLTNYIFDIGFARTILGGPWRHQNYSAMGTFISANSWGMSIPFIVSYQTFSISNQKNVASKLTGAALAIKTGSRMHYELNSSSALTAEAMYVPLSVAASVERVSYSGLEVSVGWRRMF